MATPKERVSAKWTDANDLVFIELCLIEIGKGNRPGTSLSKEGWKNVLKEFHTRTGSKLDHKQLKNRWDLMKKEWALYKNLMRGCTGIGWDPVRKTIDASDEWWEEQITDCIGAIDGTHVMARLKKTDELPYIGRKGYATQNILAVCDFNLCFTFAWAGWEGSAHDSRILSEATTRPELNFPHPANDKYYLLDAGYAHRLGYMGPYKGSSIRYHLEEFRRENSQRPRRFRSAKEKFNYLHSSCRNVIERTFGVWKARFLILQKMPFYPIARQTDIVIATMTIHNYIRKKNCGDAAFAVAEQESFDPSTSTPGCSHDTEHERVSDNNNIYWQAVRDSIRDQIVIS